MNPAQKRRLANRRSKYPRVALLVDTSSSWGRRIIRGVHNYLLKHGPWQLFLETRGLEEHRPVPHGWEGDGIIARISDVQMARKLAEMRIPVVNVSGIQLPEKRFLCVTGDLEAASIAALKYFTDRGFKHFAYFSLLGLSYVATQQKAFLGAVREAGHECAVYSVKPDHGAEPDWNLNLADLGDWLKRMPKPLAVLAWNASSSREIIYACQVAGLLVPEEVAVLSGSDDDVLCEYIHPPISGIMVAAEQCGYQAAQLLDRLLHRKSFQAKSILVPPLGIITRQSTDTLAIHDVAMIKALNFIRTNASQRISVPDITRQAGVCRRVLEHRFKQTIGRSPANEIRRVHIERAKQLLVETDLPIPDVAESAGFGTPEYLAYAFKREMGTTPLSYRKKVRAR